ncbi:class I adenylate-forming enzyme family protein [Mycolicibacterium obuense]|uniref:Long-chain fatty acid--CoA ligase n=1 Tax=Mycolicibacterium obuense TaxID=1807 RepID=A0A0M2K8N7_9MYCO|nr:class I adenylate-forming enzyme family protein [Mycolicibacterium obuense]KKF03558.1 long-chain fatty acid--CoA ligase [Mycolicibacterium obuense]
MSSSEDLASPVLRPGGTAHLPADCTVPLVEHTVGQLLSLRASDFPDREAVVGMRHGSDVVTRLTYAELLDEANRAAVVLRTLVPPGGFVALWAPNVIEWTIIQYGAALAGVVLVALNPVLRDDELDYAVRHSGAAILLHARVSRDYDLAAVAERVCANIPDVRRMSLDEFIARLPDDPTAVEAPADDPDAAVMLQYTSGTTGRPKGVLLTHRALINVAKLTMENAGIRFGAVCFNPLPLFHTAGCVIATLGPLWVAGVSILCQRFVPRQALSTLRDEGAEVLFYVPTLLAALLDEQRASAEPAPQLDVVMGGAANVPAQLIDGVSTTFGATVLNLYGQTELAPVLSMTRPQDDRDDRLTSVGRPLPQVECKIIDPDTGRTVGVGETGEICARGYQQFVEYLHDPAATARALDAEGFVRTGDLGMLDERGFLSVTGRLKELIIRGGENIAPAEVENAIGSHTDISDVVALGLPDERWGEIVAVACRLRPGAGPELRDDLIAFAKSRLPAYKVPARWFVVDDFPVTPTGKVQRFALRDAAAEQRLREI